MRGSTLYRVLVVITVTSFLYFVLPRQYEDGIITASDIAQEIEKVQPKQDSLIEEMVDLTRTATAERSVLATTSPIVRKTLLIWNVPPTVTYAKTIDEKCGHCDVTDDRTLLNSSDAVVFHYRKIEELPETRKSDQLFVWLCRESPATTKLLNLRLERYDNYFNATMTHRRESEIFSPYLRPLTEDVSPFLHVERDMILKSKRGLAAWVVSNCGTSKSATVRLLYVSSLKKAGLRVERFGKCFNQEFPPYRSMEAIKKLNEYKFYLAFENSYHCRDYVSEKFWKNGILSGTVPVVWGPHKDDILRIAPPKSFIYAEDFDSPQKLVNYLNFLDKNDEEYLKFFDWRRNLPKGGGSLYINQAVRIDEMRRPKIKPTNWMLDGITDYGYCELCRTLHSNRMHRTSTIPSLNEFWYDHERAECLKT